MTANAMEADKEKSRQAGMNDHISKPIDPELLYKTLHRWLYAAIPSDAARPEA